MAIICTKCGSTNVSCEARVNPNTRQVTSYYDGAFMYGFCNDCNDEAILTDTEETKREIEENFLQFVKINGQEPLYARCHIVYKDGSEESVIIKLSSGCEEGVDDDVFYFCNSLGGLKFLAEFGMEDFIVTDCWELY